jgi:hypothetical protein
MRYAVLLLLGSVGGLLLFLARHQYEAVNLQLAGMNTVQGVVSSIGSGGDLSLKYRVASTDYEVVRSLPVNFFPRIRAGDTVALVYDAGRPDTASVRHWSKTYRDAAVIGGFGLVAIVAAFAVFVIMGSPPLAAPPRPYLVQIGVVSLDHPIEIRAVLKEFYTTLIMPIGLIVAAFLLYRYPDFMWTRWLGYPFATVLLLVGIGVIWAAFPERSRRIRADLDGIQIQDGHGARKFVWTDVAGLKRKITTQQVGSHRTYITKEVLHHFILLDYSGHELLNLNEDEPMEPVQDWLKLFAYIPQRTGLPVTKEFREIPFTVRF